MPIGPVSLCKRGCRTIRGQLDKVNFVIQSKPMNTHLWTRIAVGLIAGAGLAAVDNFAFGGEVSPIVIVALLLVIAGAIGSTWGTRGVVAAAIAWAWLPSAHLMKKVLHLPDTLHPNTYGSILKLAAFSLVVTAIGFGFGLLLRLVALKKTDRNTRT